MAEEYNIAQLFALAFNVSSPVYLPQLGKDNQAAIQFKGVKTITPEKAEKLSWLGTPILNPISFEEGNYNRYKENGELETIELKKFDLPPATIVDFSRAKNIIKTTMLGGSGTVKELYGFDDWKITIKGLCLDEKELKAKDQIEKILQWENLTQSIKVLGSLFVARSIYDIVIESIDTPQVQGAPKVIPFTINAISDTPIDLIEKKDVAGNDQ